MGINEGISTEQTVFCRSEIGHTEGCFYWTRFSVRSKKAAAASAKKRGWVFAKRWHCPTCALKREIE